MCCNPLINAGKKTCREKRFLEPRNIKFVTQAFLCIFKSKTADFCHKNSIHAIVCESEVKKIEIQHECLDKSCAKIFA